jgi:hypothetical protein
MSDFKGGVSFYDKGTVTTTVSFPNGQRVCRWCQFCTSDNGIRYRCRLTNRLIYTVDALHNECPIEFPTKAQPNEFKEDTQDV